ncbi:hypothetical protein [Persicobacter psychrovividus]|uniref:DUF2158 domain-containing protein n=1 Tax=Persicobacter psychrovividus TaxID=387638 RepID=A0ABM7VJ76_9BACT|nr:hypothetical protein PEPS_33120 [Persicobacter psychrovividus]
MSLIAPTNNETQVLSQTRNSKIKAGDEVILTSGTVITVDHIRKSESKEFVCWVTEDGSLRAEESKYCQISKNKAMFI